MVHRVRTPYILITAEAGIQEGKQNNGEMGYLQISEILALLVQLLL